MPVSEPALVASLLGVAALAASLTFSSSLHNLISSPRQQGWNWDVLVGNPNDLQDEEAKDGPLLADDPYVASYSAIAILAGASQGNAAIDGHLVNALLAFDPLKGYVHPPVTAGRAPGAAPMTRSCWPRTPCSSSTRRSDSG